LYVTRVLVALGGALGSVARYLLSKTVLQVTGAIFPLGTFVVNVVGCVIFGGIAGLAERRLMLPPEARVFALVGVLGGFTTFSSYAYESVALLRDGQIVSAAVNIAGQVVVGLVGLWAGLAILQ
jgi:CrcB protein